MILCSLPPNLSSAFAPECAHTWMTNTQPPQITVVVYDRTARRTTGPV
jgi:hypothetical protein